jgi:hypothetical protein
MQRRICVLINTSETHDQVALFEMTTAFLHVMLTVCLQFWDPIKISTYAVTTSINYTQICLRVMVKRLRVPASEEL